MLTWSYWTYQNVLNSLWLDEVMNDMFDVSEVNDKYSLMYEENKTNFVSINTPIGPNNRQPINNTEMQGSVLAPIKTSIQIDPIGKECIEKGNNFYQYKKLINIPPLSFTDNIAAISNCDQSSVQLNTYLNTKIEMKKLSLNSNMCKKMHFGKKC